MATSPVLNTSLNLKSCLLTPASSQEKLKTLRSTANREVYSIPMPDVAYGSRNIDFNDDILFSDITANVITPRFAKRRQLTCINMYSSESIHPGDKCHNCFTGSLLDQYLAKSLPTSCQTSRGRFVREQLSPVCCMGLKDIKPLRCDETRVGHHLSVWGENRNNYFNEYASNSSGDESTFCTSRNEKRDSTPIPPPRRKRIITKSSENKSQGQKRKKDDDTTPTRSEIGQDSLEKGESSRTVAVLRKKAQHGNQNKSSKDGSHHSTDGTMSSEYPNNDRCSIKGHETCTSIHTRTVKNINVCERFQRERNSVSVTKLSLNSNSLQFYESRQNVRKRPVMGKDAKFASIDSLSLGVLAEIKRKVHMKYGDRKRRRVKTNGILKSAVVSRPTIYNGILKSAVVSTPTIRNGILKTAVVSTPTIKETRAVFRSV